MAFKRRIIFSVCLLFFFRALPTLANTLTLLGGPNLSRPHDNFGTGYTAGVSPAFGIGMDIPLFAPSFWGTSQFELEMDLLYVHHQFQTPAAVELNTSSVMIPALFDFWFNSYLFAGAGLYFNQFVGGVSAKNLNEVPVTHNYEEYSLNKMDLGYVLAIGGSLPIISDLSVSLQGRYSAGLRNLSSTVSDSFGYRDFQILAGLSLVLNIGQWGDVIQGGRFHSGL